MITTSTPVIGCVRVAVVRSALARWPAIEAYVDLPGALRTWSLVQPWSQLCALVRVVSGQSGRETAAHEGNDSEMAPRRTVAEDMTIHVRVTAPELALLDAEVERQKTLAPGATIPRTILRGLVRELAGDGKGGKPARKPKP